MKNPQSAATIVALCVSTLIARTPQETKAVLESIAPRDTIIKVAYLKDGTPANFATETNGANVYVVSSEDGVVRKVNTVNGSLMMVNITADGKRVLFWDKNTSRTYVVNWDGTGERVVTSTGFLLEYWRDRSAGTDWAIIENGGQYRINIDNTAVKVQLSTYGCAGLGGGLSDDGTRLIVNSNGWGTAAVGSTTVQKGSGGCQASMRAGPVAQWSCNESGHERAFVNDPSGNVAFMIAMGNSRDDTGGEGARFTQHPNYFTFQYAYWGAPLPGNPVILRISDSVRIAVEDNIPPTMFCGDADAVFLRSPNAVSAERPSVRRTLNRAADLHADVFSMNGRRLRGEAAGIGDLRGVVIARGKRLTRQAL